MYNVLVASFGCHFHGRPLKENKKKFKIQYKYHSVAKDCLWVEHLKSLSKRGVGAIWMFPHLIKEEHQSHTHSDSMPFKQVIGQLKTYNRITSGFEVESWGTQHSEWHHVTMTMDFQWWVSSYIHHPLTYIAVITHIAVIVLKGLYRYHKVPKISPFWINTLPPKFLHRYFSWCKCCIVAIFYIWVSI